MELAQLRDEFIKLYGGKGTVRIFIGPGRANLIGEHTDNYGGYVFPCALQMRSAAAVRFRNDGEINIASTDLPDKVHADINNLLGYEKLFWGNYQLGVFHFCKAAGYTLTGMDMLFDETVPLKSGLSSSAAIEISTATAIATYDKEVNSKPSIDYITLAKIGKQAENDYVGVSCGIMDQFASAMGKKSHALLLRCDDLSFKYAPLDLASLGISLVISNTCKPRSLITSAYNQRKDECNIALEDLASIRPNIKCLCDLSLDEFNSIKDVIKSPESKKRAEHVISENERTLLAFDALNSGDVSLFGKYMVESNDSLRDLYEVTGFELDSLHEAQINLLGVLGTRMMGAGFGGCSVSLVKNECVEDFMHKTEEYYTKKTKLVPKFYIGEVSDGAGEIIDN